MLHSVRGKNGQGKVPNIYSRNTTKQNNIFDTVLEKSNEIVKVRLE